MNFDQYTRWCCLKCGKPGIHSWNKAIYYGIRYDDDDTPPNFNIFGDNCDCCNWPYVIAYYAMNERPRAIFGPLPFSVGSGCYNYEETAMTTLEQDQNAGTELEPSKMRDMRVGHQSHQEPTRMSLQLDKCPNCAQHGPMGLRSHPKFALRISLQDDSGYANYTAFYAHHREDIEALARALPPYFQELEEWQDGTWKPLQSTTLE